MDLFVIVFAELLLLLLSPRAKRLLHIAVLVLATYQKANLARRIRGNGSVGVFNARKDLETRLSNLGYEGKMEPLVFA